MIQELVNKYLIKEFYSLLIHIKDTETEYRLIYLKRQGTQLTILEQGNFFDIKEVLKKLKKNIPIVLVFSGKRIINKVVSNETNYLQKILFNKDSEGYYIQEYSKEENILVSIARKNDIDEYIDKFKDYDLTVLDFSIGPFVLESLIPFVNNSKSVITSDFEYDLTNSNLIIYNRDSSIAMQDFSIGGDTVFNTHILAFAGFLCYLNPLGFTKNFQTYIDNQTESFSYKIAFSVLAKSVLVLFLILLSLSYIIRLYYIDKSAEIQQEAILNSQVLDEIVILKKDRDYKKNVIANSSLGSKELLSFYISQIVKDLPEEILLERLEIFPAKTTNNPNDKIIIMPNTITIDGITPSKSSVNQWVELLSSYQWVKKVELLSYAFVKNEYLFKLSIKI